MRAVDVMTTNVITVTPETSIHALAELLCAHGVSGVPVVDAAGGLVGIVSEGDLLHRAELGTERHPERRRIRWLDRLASDRDLARDYLKSHARTVADVMTREVVTVADTTGLDEIADLLETKRIKRVAVLRDGVLVGIVSRANLVRALANAESQPPSAADLDDFAIRDALFGALRGKSWAKVWAPDVVVRDKVVHVWCPDDQPEEERQALRVAAENISGVAGVEIHLVRVPMIPGI